MRIFCVMIAGIAMLIIVAIAGFMEELCFCVFRRAYDKQHRMRVRRRRMRRHAFKQTRLERIKGFLYLLRA